MSLTVTNPSYDRVYTMYAWRDNNNRLVFTQGEGATTLDGTATRIKAPRFQLRDDQGVMNLSGSPVINLALTRPDKSEDLLACTIIDATNGIISCPITASATAIAGQAVGEIRLSSTNGTIKFFGVHALIYDGVSNSAAAQSTQFSALVDALQKVATVDPDGSNTVTLDSAIVENGTNPVASGVIYAALQVLDNAKIDKDKAVKYTGSNDLSECVDNGVLYRVHDGTTYQILLCNSGDAYRVQYMFKRSGEVVFRTSAKSNDTWGAWSTWSPIGTTSNIADGAVTTAKIADNAVTAQKISGSAVTIEKINNGAVTVDKIGNGAVSTDKIYDGAVTTPKINNGAVTSDKLGSSSVTTEKINDGAVTSAKVADNAIQSGHINDGAVGTSKLASGAITPEKMGFRAVKYVTSVELDNCIDGDTVYEVRATDANGTTGRHTVICVPATYQRTQYLFAQEGGVQFRKAFYSNDTWGAWSSWVPLTPKTTSFTVSSSGWSGLTYSMDSGMPSYANQNTKVDINLSDSVYNQLIADGCMGLYVTTETSGNTPVFTLHAVGNAPTANITIQLMLQQVS